MFGGADFNLPPNMFSICPKHYFTIANEAPCAFTDTFIIDDSLIAILRLIERAFIRHALCPASFVGH